MRQLLVAALALIPACAARTPAIVAPAAPPPIAIAPMVMEPTQELAAVDQETDTAETTDATDQTDAMVDETATAAPYALVFHEGQKWKFDVSSSVAMSSTQHTNSVDCHVAKVDYFCDREIAHVECDSEPVNQIVGGIYTKTGRGMWRASWNAASEQLDDKTRMFARFPESLVDGTGKPTAVAFHGGWCVSSDAANGATTTVCVDADHGITGGSIKTAKGTIRVGDAPRPDARVASN